MSTPTNFYKNQAYSYAKGFKISSILENLQAYKDAIDAHGPSVDNEKYGSHSPRKRQRVEKPKPNRKQIRKELVSPESASAPPPPLSSVGVNLSSALGYKPYEPVSIHNGQSDGSFQEIATFSTPKPADGASNREGRFPDVSESDSGDETKELQPVIAHRMEQRFPSPGEPKCIVCGRFGEYVCSETEDDVCSLECKEENLKRVKSASVSLESPIPDTESTQRDPNGIHEVLEGVGLNPDPRERVEFSSGVPPAGSLTLPDHQEDQWLPDKIRWKDRTTCLSSFSCWKCGQPGHFANDCFKNRGKVSQLPSNPTRYQMTVLKDDEGKSSNVQMPAKLKEMYKRCQEIQRSAPSAKCLICGRKTNLAKCLDCNSVFCDGHGHLTSHLRQNPQHKRLHSFKLRRQIKCYQPDCEEDDIFTLLSCQHCLSSAFDKHYSMYNASWAQAGLKRVATGLCCEDHFEWHRHNCPTPGCLLVNRSEWDIDDDFLSEFLF